MSEKEKLKQLLSEIERRRNTIPTEWRQLSTKYDDLEENMLQYGDVAPRDNTRIAWGRQTVPIHTQLMSTRGQMRRLVQEDKDLETEQQEIINELTKIEEREAKQKRFASMSDSERKAWVEKQRAKTEGLSEADSATDWYHAIEEDPQKRAEWDRQADIVSSVGSTIATLPFTAGIMGWVPAITTTATGTAGGYVGAAGGQELGQYLDNKYGWNTTPYLRTIGGFTGGMLGGGLGYRGWEGATNQYLINKAFKSGQLRYGQPTTYTAYHQSSTPITKFKFPFKRWDVAKHGADPNGAFFTVGKPASSGFLAERPYTGQFHVKVQKPLIQTGELFGPTKNGLRNAIVRRARRDGADAVFFDGIADNQLQNQQILFAMDNADIGYRGMVNLGSKGLLPKGGQTMYSKQFVADVASDSHHATFTPAQSSRGSYILYERPSTYFKDATYAGTPGTYAGKEVPTWQLPKGQRNQHQISSGKLRITPEERMGIPKGVRNNGKYNGITFFRTLDQVPAINSDGFVDLTSPRNTFLNTTSDDLVHLHSGYQFLKNHALAIDPEAFRGSTLATLDPMDHVFIRETLKVKPKHVTLITGDPEAIALAQQRGFNVITDPKLKIYWQRGGDRRWHPDIPKMNSEGKWEIFTHHDFKKLYDEEIRKIVTNGFSRPKMNIYENLSKQTGLPLKTQPFTGKNFVKTYSDVQWSPSDFKHVVYSPADPTEHHLMMNYGLNAMTDRNFHPLLKTSDSWGEREQWLRIRTALDKMKQDIKPLKQGGKIENPDQ